MPSLKFLFDYGSPTAYLAWARLPGLVERTGVTLEMVPMLLGAVFKATGNAPPGTIAAKGRWMATDMEIWAKRDGTPFVSNPYFPVNTTRLMRGALVAMDRGEFEPYANAMFGGMWREARNMADADAFTEVLLAANLDAAAYGAAVEDPAIKERLRANTDAAVAAGVFGAPTFLVGDRLFFGQDRMDLVEAAIRGEL
jgi:2-hydroxychromene-2-carboxylate isomerase